MTHRSQCMLCPQPKVGWDCSRRITLSNSGICGICGLSLSCAACVPVIEPFIRSALPLLALVTHARMMTFKCLLNMNATFSIAVSFNDIVSRNQLSKNMYASTTPSYGICISCRNCSLTAQASATYITWASILLPCYFSANFRECNMKRRVCNMQESVCDKIGLSLQQ